MDYLLISLVALIGSALTLFSGFGLGTLLVPVFGLFFPIEVAISMTAIVHFLNNIFKLFLTAKHANKSIVLQFGIPSLLAALLGAYVLTFISHLEPLLSYIAFGNTFYVTPVKLIISGLILFFSLFELLPYFNKLQFDSKYLLAGGLLSGFFGGLSGNQGALRSAFLIKSNLSKEAYIGTGVVIACMVDVSRLSIYSSKFFVISQSNYYALIGTAVLSAFTGAYFGNKLVKKITLHSLQLIVSVFLILFAVFLGMGII